MSDETCESAGTIRCVSELQENLYFGLITYPEGYERTCILMFLPTDADEITRRRFVNEAMLGVDLSGGHANLLTTLRFGEWHDGRLFMASEPAPGKALSELMDQNRLVGRYDEIRTIVRSVLLALAYLHHHRVSHGTVTPSNILVADDGVVRIGNFSRAKQFDSASPRHADIGVNDLRSLGKLLFELLTQVPLSLIRGLSKDDIWRLCDGMPVDLVRVTQRLVALDNDLERDELGYDELACGESDDVTANSILAMLAPQDHAPPASRDGARNTAIAADVTADVTADVNTIVDTKKRIAHDGTRRHAVHDGTRRHAVDDEASPDALSVRLLTAFASLFEARASHARQSQSRERQVKCERVTPLQQTHAECARGSLSGQIWAKAAIFASAVAVIIALYSLQAGMYSPPQAKRLPVSPTSAIVPAGSAVATPTPIRPNIATASNETASNETTNNDRPTLNPALETTDTMATDTISMLLPQSVDTAPALARIVRIETRIVSQLTDSSFTPLISRGVMSATHLVLTLSIENTGIHAAAPVLEYRTKRDGKRHERRPLFNPIRGTQCDNLTVIPAGATCQAVVSVPRELLGATMTLAVKDAPDKPGIQLSITGW